MSIMNPPSPSFAIRHSTSHPFRFFGRAEELALLDQAIGDADLSVIALIGPGGQGKTAIVQTWLERLAGGGRPVHGVFLWSFYRGKDADLCLRELYGTVARLAHVPDVSASFCVDRLLPLLRERCWVVALDGTEVVQYDAGPWLGRFAHPELGRLVEDLASAPARSVVVLTTRFPLPELTHRFHTRLLALTGLDEASARSLLKSLGVQGEDWELDEAAAACGFHAKAVELLGTYLVRFHAGQAPRHRDLPDPPMVPGYSEAEHKVTRVLAAFQTALSREAQDVLALATAFREPPTERQLLDYLESGVIHALLHETWGRGYVPLNERGRTWLAGAIQDLVALRLLERVELGAPGDSGNTVIDAHPLIRRTFEHALGVAGRRQSAVARAGFLSGRPDRRRAASLEEMREEVELFHAYGDAGLWEEADRTFVALDKPRYRFLVPALERDLLLRFFPEGDWRRPPLWPRFRHYRSLAICLELLGRFEDALAVYREEEAALRGDALIALGRLEPLLEDRRPPHPWEMLWQGYRAHALCLAGRTGEAADLARRLVPRDTYEWTHVFECLLRADRLMAVDMRGFLDRPPAATESRWEELARRRMRADFARVTKASGEDDPAAVYGSLLEEYDRGGMPWERSLVRLSEARRLLGQEQVSQAQAVNAVTLDVTRRHEMRILEADAWRLEREIGQLQKDPAREDRAAAEEARLRGEASYRGPGRP